MNRLIKIIAGVAVLGAAGVSGFWFWNKTEAQNQIELSLAALERAGVQTRHEGLEIEGFPLSYTGKLKNFTAKLPAQGVSFAFPEFTAGMSATSVGTVDFAFPSEFFVTLIDASGAETGQVFVTSENLAANVRPTAKGAYDLGVAADMLRVSRGSSGAAANDHVQLRTLSASGALTADETARNIVIDLAMTSNALSASFLAAPNPDAEPTQVKVEANQLSLAADGDLMAQKATLGVERMAVDATPQGGFQLSGIALDLNSTAAAGFDPSSLFEMGRETAQEPEDTLALLLRIAAQSVVQGGAIETTLGIGDIAGNMIVPGETGPASLKVVSKNFGYRAGVAPERMGGGITADALRVEIEDQAGLYYDVTNAEVTLTFDAADSFDLMPIATAGDGDASGAAFLAMLSDHLRRGGSAALVSRSDVYETITTLPPELGLPFERLTSRTGANVAEVALTGEKATMSVTGQDIAYTVAGGTEGSIANDSFAFTLDLPVRQSDAPQEGRLSFVMDGVTATESLWDLIDPQNALTREVKTIAIEGRAGISIQRDILAFAPEADGAPPFGFETVALDRVTLDLLGFRGDATGEVGLAPAPNGAVTITLARWRHLLESLSKTALVQDPQVGMSVLLAGNWIEAYGKPGATEDETVLEIAIDPATGLAINGKPLQ